jgi:hypothetical protein
VGFCNHPHRVSVAKDGRAKIERPEIKTGIISSVRFTVLQFPFNRKFDHNCVRGERYTQKASRKQDDVGLMPKAVVALYSIVSLYL